MCQPTTDFDSNNLDRLRDGTTTDTQDYTNMNTDTLDGNNQRKLDNTRLDRALNENWQWYFLCLI